MQPPCRLIAPFLAAALIGCAGPEPQPVTQASATERQVLMHTVTGSKLRNSINRLNSQMLEVNQTGPALDRRQSDAAAQVAEVADGAANTVNCLRTEAPKLHLDADRLKRFHALIDDLRGQAETLKTQAQTLQLAGTSATLTKLDATCTACHRLVRIDAVPES